MALTPDEIAEAVCLEFSVVSKDRTNFESQWEDIATRILPTYRGTMRYGSYSSPGERRNLSQFDSTGAMALSRFTAILTSLLTPDNAVWHRIRPSNRELLKDRRVRLWFEEVNVLLHDYRRRPTANFSGQNLLVYQSLGAFGTGALFIDGFSKGPGMRYRNIPMGELFLTENHQGVINGAYRCFKMTAEQIVSKWPNAASILKDDLSQATGRAKEYEVIHAVKENDALVPYRLDHAGMAYTSAYVLKSLKKTLQVGGYRTFPYAVGRYEQGPGEVYGRSPAMAVLPSLQVINEQKKVVLKQGHRTVDPVLLVHDDGILDGFSMVPGALNSGGVNKDGRALVQTLPIGRVDIGKDMMDDERAVINDAFLVSLFQILVDAGGRMTATEVLERAREKGILLAPTVGRQQSEYLGPLIERELDIMSAQGLLPPPPPLLVEAGAEYEVEYDNPVSRSARAEEAVGVQRSLEAAVAYAAQTGDLSPLDWFNMDEITPDTARISGVPERYLNGEQVVQAKRQQRAEQAEQEQMMQAAPGMAALMSSSAKVQAASKA